MDKKNFNSKSTPIQMRELIKRVRTGDYVGESKDNKIKKDMNMRDMLKITRKLNEDVNPDNKQNKPANFPSGVINSSGR